MVKKNRKEIRRNTKLINDVIVELRKEKRERERVK
jgi:hypothetical protein